MTKQFYITTAISYPNGVPHIGHAYELIATDALARFKRLDGYDVFFLTGTDEHGQKMQQTAQRENTTPQALADKNSARFKEMLTAFNASADDFIRTTEERHQKCAMELWQRMEKNGDIYLDRYAGWYSVRDEAYYTEDETTQLPDGRRVAPNGTTVEWTEEESYFFRLSLYQDKLLKFYQDNPGFIGPDVRRNEIMSFVKGGLQDLSVSRTTFDWGIPVPQNPKHVMYVWVDALTNYLSATGYFENGSRKKFWPADIHIIGKDIIRFHAVYWPAFLISAGLPLPKKVFAHGFLTVRGEKMSKSLGNVIDPFELANKFGVDALRYFLLREVSFGQDGSYSEEAIINRLNAELANDLGNLAQRSLSMIAKNDEGKMPLKANFSDADVAMFKMLEELDEKVRKCMEQLSIHTALSEIWAVIGEANRYFASSEPWAQRKVDMTRYGTTMWLTLESLRRCGILLQAFIPDAARKLLDLLAIPDDERQILHIEKAELPKNVVLPKPSAIFPRYVAPEQQAS